MEGKELKKEFEQVVSIAKEMIRNFAVEVFDWKTLDKVEEAFTRIKFNIDNDSSLEATGYCEGLEISLMEHHLIEDKNTIEVIATTIHEIEHALSNIVADREGSIEEGFAELFAEMVINNWLKQGKEISYISEEEYNILKEKGFFSTDCYTNEGEFLRSILYALKQKGKDIETIRKYIFESEDDFIDVCEEVLGHDIADIIYEVKGMQGKVNIKSPVTKEMIKIIDKNFEEELKKECSKSNKTIKKRSLYAIESPILLQAYFDKFIQKYLELDKDNKIDDKNLQRLINFLEKKSRAQYSEYGLTDFSKKLIYSWYLQCNGDMDKFKMILGLTNGIHFEQVARIINDEKTDGNIDFDYILSKYREYNVEVNEEAMDYLLEYYKDPSKINYMLSKCDTINAEGPYLCGPEILFLKGLNLNEEEQKTVFKYFYSSNREECVRNMVNLLLEKDILTTDIRQYKGPARRGARILAQDISKELLEIADLQDIIDMHKEIQDIRGDTMTKIILDNLDLDTIIFLLEEEIEEINEYYQVKTRNEYARYITNKDEILENISNRNFKSIDIKCIENPIDMSFLAEEGGYEDSTFRVIFNQFCQHIKDAPTYNNDIQRECFKLLDEKLEIDPSYQKHLVKCIKERLETDKQWDDANRKGYFALLEETEIELGISKNLQYKETEEEERL